jgi:hypothetical protein
MNQIAFGEMKKFGAAKLKEYLPLEVLVDGVPTFVLSNLEGIAVIEHLHIRVRNRVKAMIAKASQALPPPTRVDYEVKRITADTG